MTNWNMRTEPLELKDGSTIKNYHYEFNSTDRVFAKIVEDVFKAIMDISADHKDEPTSSKMKQVETMSCQECKHFHENAVMYLDQCDFCFKDCKYEPKDEPQTEDWHTWRDEQEYNDRWSE